MFARIGIFAYSIAFFACLFLRQSPQASHDLRKDLLSALKRKDFKSVGSLIEKGAPVDVKDDDGVTPLMAMVFAGETPGVRIALGKRVDVNAVDKEGDSALIYAAGGPENLEIIRLLLQHGINVNKGDNVGLTPLMRFASDGYLKTVLLLLQAGADVNARPGADPTDNDTPLFWAIEANHIEVAKLLLDHGVRASLKGGPGRYVWGEALASKHKSEWVPLLLRYGLDVNMTLTWNWTPLLSEAGFGDADLVRMLLQHGAHANDKLDNGTTALMRACRSGNLEIVKMLVARGAVLDARNEIGETALTEACGGGHSTNLSVVKFLLQKGLDVKVKDKFGDTLLICAARVGDADVVQLLLSKGLDPAKVNDHGDTAFLCAVKEGFVSVAALLLDAQKIQRLDRETSQKALLSALHVYSIELMLNKRNPPGIGATVQLLLEKGASVTERNEEGLTPLLYGVRSVADEQVNVWNDLWPAFDAMLKAGAEVNAQDKEGRTGLFYTARSAKTEMTRYLLEKGADVNRQDNSGGTALMSLCQGGSKDDTPYQAHASVTTMEMLLTHGADLNLKDKEGKTALLIAEQKGLAALVDLLKRHGAKDP